MTVATSISRSPADKPPKARGRKRGISAFWMKQFHTWHWLSSAVCLVGMLLFAITGITLNHSSSIEADPQVESVETVLPETAMAALGTVPEDSDADTPIPHAVAEWLSNDLDISLAGRTPEWSADELYIPLPRAGGDGWVAIDRMSGDVLYEDTDRGWISYFNDLHKGRDTGTAWSWFIDIFAGACVVFSLTGFLLLQLHARRRPMTWPTVGLGVIIPVFLMIFLMH
ncbi:PepSY-associated TM helix domain-containing protein [Altericroceibacterium endophyticum]|uniref:Peptidase n=1 Tax=Altericroceibacterium endophyticum TaxID=1808508 RepID=A0A6I4T3T8_9SPHN|nr:PepSY-associated TM helix domain-containing protein [Altericroceibacterium endophyticum]MXO64959.1 hypothetical protein [Altericroceibacterium endophyticum]